MSWQIIETGMARDVEAKIARDIAVGTLPEPEHSVRAIIAGALAKILETYPDHYGVQVKARGAQMPAHDFDTAQTISVVNALHLVIEPLPGYGIKPNAS
jgi:hypothetical protein